MEMIIKEIEAKNVKLFIGSVTDPYQPIEEKYGRTHALLKEL